jgi:hypothetical protein
MIRIIKYLYYLFYRTKIFFPLNTYSTFGEDLILQKFLKKKKGFYVDIGCYHPYEGNNTYLLYKKGWSGINIDIQKINIDLFNVARPDDINICCALYDKKKILNLY